MTLGITVGKFFPFHRGHDHLIREAKRHVDDLVVLLGYKPNDQVKGSVRAGWIRTEHPDVEVVEVLDDIPEAPEPWAKRALEVLNGRQPELAFTSEDYGEPWAEAMGARHLPIDRGRAVVPISGTELRQNLGGNWDWLMPSAKAYFARRVCVLGSESTGTTTLSRDLAKHYRTVWVPEAGRAYWEGRRHTERAASWDTDEFVRIARMQIRAEDDLARLANKLVVCDTDALATHVWHRRYRGEYSSAVEALADSRSYDLYLLTEPDFEFVQDGTREGRSIRDEMHEWFRAVLEQKKRNFIGVAGSPEHRLSQSIESIEPLLRFPPF